MHILKKILVVNRMSIIMGLVKVPIVVGLTGVASLRCSLLVGGRNQNQSNVIP